jgi:hypothetical protein
VTTAAPAEESIEESRERKVRREKVIMKLSIVFESNLKMKSSIWRMLNL